MFHEKHKNKKKKGKKGMKDKHIFCLLHFFNRINHFHSRSIFASEMKPKHTLHIGHQVMQCRKTFVH